MNVKCVAILSSSLLLLAVLVAGAAYVTLTKSGEDHIADGDQFVAIGDFESATKSYSKAVNDNPTNVDWLKKWQDALLNTIPETDLEYSQGYSEHYLGILQKIASLQPEDPEAQHEMLDAIYKQLRLGGGNAESWSSFVNTCDSAYAYLDESQEATQKLRRYRGFGRVAQLSFVAISTDEKNQAMEDLTAAYDADNTDIDAILQLAAIYRYDWIQSLNSNRTVTQDAALEKLADIIDEIKDAFPDHPRAAAADLDFKIESQLRQDSTMQGQNRIRRGLAGVEAPMVEMFLSCDTDLLTDDLLVNSLAYGRALWNVRPDDYNEIGLEITERVLADRPDDFEVMFFRGSQLVIAGEYRKAEELLEKVTDLPDLPISLKGLRLKSVRVNAVYQLANNALAEWRTLPAGDAKDAALAAAEARLHELEDELGADNQMSMLIAGQVAIGQQRFSDAVAVLQRLNTLSNSENVNVLRLLSSALAKQGTLGAALDQYDKWIELDPRNPAPLVESAQILMQLRNPEQAIARLRMAAEILPDNEAIQQQLNTLIVSTQGDSDLEATDPVVAGMMRAEAVARGDDGDMNEAISMLETIAEENPDDARPLTLLIELKARTGDTDGALQHAMRGQELLPGNETFNRYAAMLRTGDRGVVAEQYIDEGGEPEPVRLVRKYALNKQMDNMERAQTFLDEAESRYPGHPAVLDALFVKALQDKDAAKARSVAAMAAEHNADQADGLLFQARLNIFEENYETAQNNLQLAVEKAPFSPQAWRLYGQVLLRTGRIEDAVNSLARAYEYKPDDAEIAKTYASTLIQLSRLEAALEVVNAARRFTSTDEQLNEIWLALESEVGDPETAIGYRQAIFDRDPQDSNNTKQLIALMTKVGRFEDAEVLIQGSMEEGEPDLGLAVIQARWHAEQGDVDEGQKLIREYIASLDPAELTEAPFLSLGNFLIANGDDEGGLAAFREGAQHQSPEMMTADRRLGDYYFSAGDYEEALASYKKVTDAGADSTGVVAKRVIETLQRLKRWDEAEQALNALAAGEDDDMQTMLLRADIANGRGDSRTAHEMVNRAVEMAPNKPEPFIRRAQLDFNNPERLSFVLSDLEQAIRLVPNSMQPRHMRADVLIKNGRSAEAISELRRGITAIPDNSELRRMLIQELWITGRHDESHAEAKAAVQANPDNSVWLMVAGDIASRDDKLRNNWEVALDYFEQAYAIDDSLALALRVANACLYIKTPDPDRAIAALMKQGDGFETNSSVLILRARATELKGDHEEAVNLAERSVAQAVDVGELRHWFLHMETIFEDQAEMIRFVDEMRSSSELMPAYKVHAAAFIAYDPDRRKQIIADLQASEGAVRAFAEQDGNDATLVALYRVLGQLSYGQEDFISAEDAFAKGVELLPDDMEFNNNLAYTRAKYLNDLEGALAPAEKAVQISPANSPALDTLGWIYYRLGRLGQAKQRISRAIQNAETPIEKGGSYLHMAQVLLAEGDRPEARKYAELANDIIKTNPRLGTEFNTDFNALMTELEEAENTQ